MDICRIDEETVQKIKQLELQYERNWGKKVDYSILPPRITQEKLVTVLERIVETGESVLVGWTKLEKKCEIG